MNELVEQIETAIYEEFERAGWLDTINVIVRDNPYEVGEGCIEFEVEDVFVHVLFDVEYDELDFKPVEVPQEFDVGEPVSYPGTREEPPDFDWKIKDEHKGISASALPTAVSKLMIDLVYESAREAERLDSERYIEEQKRLDAMFADLQSDHYARLAKEQGEEMADVESDLAYDAWRENQSRSR